MSAPEPTGNLELGLQTLATSSVVANDKNPRLDFPQTELDRLTDSIAQEGILVPIVVFPRNGQYVLVDGERRFRCALTLGMSTVPALVTTERPEKDTLLQMFNIHLIREQWRDLPTALAVGELVDAIQKDENRDPDDKEIAELTGLSIERVRQLRYVVTLPKEWQNHIREGRVPLNFFWELKKYVLDPIARRRPDLVAELGADEIRSAMVQKRLDGVITDTVSLRKVSPVIGFAEQQEGEPSEDNNIDESLKSLFKDPDVTIDDVYDDAVQMMVEVDKLGRRTQSMARAFRRLLVRAESTEEREAIRTLGQQFVDELSQVLQVTPANG